MVANKQKISVEIKGHRPTWIYLIVDYPVIILISRLSTDRTDTIDRTAAGRNTNTTLEPYHTLMSELSNPHLSHRYLIPEEEADIWSTCIGSAEK